MKRFIIVGMTCALAISGWSLAESEPNGSSGSANGPFSFPDTITGNFTTNDGEGQSDFFSFNASVGTQYSFVATPTGSGVDPDLGIWSGGSNLVNAQVGGVGQTETLNWTATGTGTFALEVFSGTGAVAPFGAYSVSASITAGINDWDLY